MRLDQVAATTFSVSRFCQDREGLEQSLRRIREIGYTAIQLSGIGQVPEAEIVRICAGLGLKICATHEPAGRIAKDTAAVIERLRQLDCTITAYPYPHVPFDGIRAVDQLARDLALAGAAMAVEGMTLLYHNHDIEFMRLGGELILDRIYAKTDPAHLGGEPDTYWIQRGGGEPSGWCRKLRGRMPVIHMKDYRLNEAREPEMCAIGSGNLDWPRIVAEAEDSGCRWFVVEHDNGTFESLAESFGYIRDTLCL